MGGGGGGEGAECALCGAAAVVYCEADAAFLCAACDGKVHGANFLASRHQRRRVVGPEVAVVQEEEEEGYESGASAASSTSCVSTADSASSAYCVTEPGLRGRGRRPRERARAEVVLEGWAKRMGFPAGAARRRAAAAGRALRACGRDVAAARVPLRVAMAAALWCEVAAHGAGAGAGFGQAEALRRLEACAHVPARLLMAVASSMARLRARRRAAVDSQEGWDECSCAEPNGAASGEPHARDTTTQK